MKNNYNKLKIIWISWEQHRRTETLSKKIGAVLYVFSSKNKRIIKHPIFTIKTINILIKNKPDIVFVQNPSVILSLIVISLKHILNYKTIVDAHNAGVYPYSKILKKVEWIFKIIHKYADYTIVTNNKLAIHIADNGGRAIVLPDAIPNFESIKGRQMIKNQFIVTYICTFSSDEPYEEVIRSAYFLPENVKLFITGDFRKIIKTKEYLLSDNIAFTGFIPDSQYVQLLSNSDCIVDLTTRPDCLVCGAYEAIALSVPLILSDTSVQREYFKKGTLYTKNDYESIAKTIISAMQRKDLLKKEMVEFRKQIVDDWEKKYKYLQEKILL